MSDSTPAALNASPSNGRSAFSQRADDCVSGRITPTLALVSVFVELEPLLPLLFEPESSSLPQAATVNASAPMVAAAATRVDSLCFMYSPFPPLTADLATICEFEVFIAECSKVKL